MASDATPLVPMGDAPPDGAALQHKHWRKLPDLSSGLARCEQFLAGSQFELANWAVVAFAAGIAAWFAAANSWQWRSLIAVPLALSLGAGAAMRSEGLFPYLGRSLTMAGLAIALVCSFVWAKSAMVGTAPVARPTVATFVGRVLAREEQPAEDRLRLRLATREPGTGRVIQIRVNLEQSGGLTIDLEHGRIRTVAEDEGQHGWWSPPQRLPRKPRGPEPSGSADADAASANYKPQ